MDVSNYNVPGLVASDSFTERLQERWRHDHQVPDSVQPHPSSRHHWRVGRNYHRCRRFGRVEENYRVLRYISHISDLGSLLPYGPCRINLVDIGRFIALAGLFALSNACYLRKSNPRFLCTLFRMLRRFIPCVYTSLVVTTVGNWGPVGFRSCAFSKASSALILEVKQLHTGRWSGKPVLCPVEVVPFL